MKLYLEEKSLSQSISGVRWKGKCIKNEKRPVDKQKNNNLHTQFKIYQGMFLHSMKIILKKI